MIDFYLFTSVFLISLFIIFLLIQAASKIDWLIHKSDSYGIQKFHVEPTPSIGGLSVFLAFSFGLWSIDEKSSILVFFWLTSLPVFLAGLIEDITLGVPPIWRLFFTFISILIAYIWMEVSINSLGFSWIDGLLFDYPALSLILTLLVVGGAVNSLNIIDGFNGLLGGYSILASLAIAYVSYSLGDEMIMQLSLILTAAVLGFFIFNFPFGKIFMGDGGAYFIGIILAIIGLMLVDRHVELSNWFVLLIFIYPMYELLYSIYRRKIIHKTDATQPDSEHMHSLIYRKLISCDRFKHDKVICNSMVSPFLWLLSLVGIIPAVVWYNDQILLIIFTFVFMLIYTVIYKLISSDGIKFNK
jgi:UDP-GlcNAc:undecaprenyl-phosphate/decaprenyl-phosphate GlcNAc-1-phosphate transferase